MFACFQLPTFFGNKAIRESFQIIPTVQRFMIIILRPGRTPHFRKTTKNEKHRYCSLIIYLLLVLWAVIIPENIFYELSYYNLLLASP